MHYEVVCSVVRTAEDRDDDTRRALMEAVAAFERMVRRRGLAAVVQVRDVHGGHTLHEAVHPGGFSAPPPTSEGGLA
ncbi:hypothetical protein [Azospirillum sp.]|uniref:hypothetical protein n=1 Tax=Azospirillum sp. TaxID=34012 RepID=UPI003D74D27E